MDSYKLGICYREWSSRFLSQSCVIRTVRHHITYYMVEYHIVACPKVMHHMRHNYRTLSHCCRIGAFLIKIKISFDIIPKFISYSILLLFKVSLWWYQLISWQFPNTSGRCPLPDRIRHLSLRMKRRRKHRDGHFVSKILVCNLTCGNSLINNWKYLKNTLYFSF